MTESLRLDGEHPAPSHASYQQSLSAYPGQQASSYANGTDTGTATASSAHARTTGFGSYPAPPGHDPAAGPTTPHTAPPQTATLTPPPAYPADPAIHAADPTEPAPYAHHPTPAPDSAGPGAPGFPGHPGASGMPGAGGAPRRRARAPFALLAAVALVAGAVGGGTAYAVQQLNGHHDTAQAAVTGTPVAEADRGTVSGVASAVSPSIVEVSAAVSGGTSTGSGVIVSSGGEIVTNNHVISGASEIKAKTSDGKSYTAEVVGTDANKDLALIRLANASGLKAATLGDSSSVQVGDQVVAIGSPEGLTGTVTSGIVSALDRDVTVPVEDQQDQGGPGQGGDGSWPFEFGGKQFNGDTGSSKTTYKALQTDASLNPGNSGGALINMAGQIIGINSAMYSPATANSSTSSDAGSVGLGFAIPINTVKSDLTQLRNGGSDN